MLATALVALAAIVLGTHAMEPLALQTPTSTAAAGPPESTARAKQGNEPDWSTPTAQPRPRTAVSGLRSALTTLIAAVVLILAVLLVLWIVRRSRWLLDRPEAAAGEYDEEQDDPQLGAAAAAAALAQASSRLEMVTGHAEAIIAAWLALEEAIARAGVVRAPSQTTLEHVREVLGSLDLDDAELTAFADLFRRARFGATPMQAADREHAARLLDSLRDQLRAAGSGATHSGHAPGSAADEGARS